MMKATHTMTTEQTHLLSLPYGCDLLTELTAFCRTKRITTGLVSGIGAVSRATFGYYDQQKREYVFQTRNEELEILNLTGNISLREGEPFVHSHITLSETSGICCGGHLAEGTTVFAAEMAITCLGGADLNRGYDTETGLYLWE